ncbi:hypothetical protein SAMN06272755_3341 [Picosynechococcus sp. OG1]|nr:hypothetical protein SAMN06272755_3341 [Picosynechococcus sp. OG1]
MGYPQTLMLAQRLQGSNPLSDIAFRLLLGALKGDNYRVSSESLTYWGFQAFLLACDNPH